MYYQFSPDPKMEQPLIFLTLRTEPHLNLKVDLFILVISMLQNDKFYVSYDLPVLNVKILGKLQSRRILDKEAGLICSELKQALAYILNSQDIEFYRNKQEFQ